MKVLWRRERRYVAIPNMEVWLRLARLAPDVPDGWSFADVLRDPPIVDCHCSLLSIQHLHILHLNRSDDLDFLCVAHGRILRSRKYCLPLTIQTFFKRVTLYALLYRSIKVFGGYVDEPIPSESNQGHGHQATGRHNEEKIADGKGLL